MPFPNTRPCRASWFGLRWTDMNMETNLQVVVKLTTMSEWNGRKNNNIEHNEAVSSFQSKFRSMVFCTMELITSWGNIRFPSWLVFVSMSSMMYGRAQAWWHSWHHSAEDSLLDGRFVSGFAGHFVKQKHLESSNLTPNSDSLRAALTNLSLLDGLLEATFRDPNAKGRHHPKDDSRRTERQD